MAKNKDKDKVIEQYFLLEIELSGSKESADVVLESALGTGVQGLKVLHALQVTGEHRIISVIQGNSNKVSTFVNKVLTTKSGYQTICVPLRPYEKYAEKMMYPSRTPSEAGSAKGKKKVVEHYYYFWLELEVQYEANMDDLIVKWKNEAEDQKGRKRGLELFKVIAERKVHVFVAVQDPEMVDDIEFHNPSIRDNNDYVQIKCRSLTRPSRKK